MATKERKKRKIPEGQTKFVHLSGDLSQGAPIDNTSTRERVLVPTSKIDDGEIVFRARAHIPDMYINAGDLLIVEHRKPSQAATGETVIVMVEDRAFVGHWWAKRGERTLFAGGLALVTEDKAMQILGAVTVILRHQ
jgi:SOS-response transcriptional repressor LexA